MNYIWLVSLLSTLATCIADECFGHRAKLVIPRWDFNCRHLHDLMLGRQDVYKLCIFPYGFYTLLNQLERNLKALVLFYFVKWCYLRSMANLNTFTPIVRLNTKFAFELETLKSIGVKYPKMFCGSILIGAASI